MKRVEIEERITKVNEDVKSRIEVNPVYAVLVALVAGFLLGVFAKYLLPLILLVALGLGVFWYVADVDGDEGEADKAAKPDEGASDAKKSKSKGDKKSNSKKAGADSRHTNGDGSKGDEVQPVS